MNTKKIVTGLMLVFSVVLLLNSCKEDEIDVYNGETNVYFSLKRWLPGYNGANYFVNDFLLENGSYADSCSWRIIQNAKDSILVSLALDGTDVGERIALIPVSISGNVADYDRNIEFTLDNEVTTAVKGEHFSIEGHIPAGKNIGAIAVHLNRSAFKDTTMTIGINLVPNEHFQTNYRVINRSTSDTTKVDMLSFRLVATSVLVAPPKWETNLKYYFGPFSRKKVFLILELTKGDIEELYSDAPSLSLMPVWGKTLKNYLIDQKNKGNTIYEEDGVTEMIAGTSV